MADKAPTFDLDGALKETIARLSQFEEDVQSGAADEIDDSAAKHRTRERARAKQLLKYRSDVQQIASRADGRRVLWRILEICGPNRISHTPGDPYTTAFNEGKRSVGNEILLLLWDNDSGTYAQMQREHSSDLKTEQERRRKETESNGN